MNELAQLFYGYVLSGLILSGFFGIAALIVSWFTRARR